MKEKTHSQPPPKRPHRAPLPKWELVLLISKVLKGGFLSFKEYHKSLPMKIRQKQTMHFWIFAIEF